MVEKNQRKTADDFKNHEHTERNGLVKPLNNGFGGGEGLSGLCTGSSMLGKQKPDEVYF